MRGRCLHRLTSQILAVQPLPHFPARRATFDGVTQRHEEIAQFIQNSPTLRPLLLSRQLAPPFREPYPSAEQIAGELLADSEFQALRLATWLRSPDGKLIADAMALVISPAYRPEFELAVQAMQLAAATQYEQGGSQRTAGALALAVVSIFGVTVLAPALRRGPHFPRHRSEAARASVQ